VEAHEGESGRDLLQKSTQDAKRRKKGRV
jgi:hypothetical protein